MKIFSLAQELQYQSSFKKWYKRYIVWGGKHLSLFYYYNVCLVKVLHHLPLESTVKRCRLSFHPIHLSIAMPVRVVPRSPFAPTTAPNKLFPILSQQEQPAVLTSSMDTSCRTLLILSMGPGWEKADWNSAFWLLLFGGRKKEHFHMMVLFFWSPGIKHGGRNSKVASFAIPLSSPLA